MQFDFNLPAFGGQRIETAGKFIRYVSGTGRIRIATDKNESVDLLPGQGVHVAGGFSSVSIVDRTGLPNTGLILAGMLEFIDDNVYGTLSLRDSSADLVVANKAFMGNGKVTNFNSGQSLYGVWLYNLANSGKITKIRSMRYTAAGSLPSGFQVRAFPCSLSLGGTSGAASKFAGGAKSTTIVSSEGLGASYLADKPPLIDFVPVLSSDKFELRDPIVLPPGSAFLITNALASESQVSNWNVEFTEE